MAETTAPQVKLKAIALPAEHGGWGFLIEPLILGMLVAPSLAGFFLVLATFGAFLARQPLKIAFTDRRRGRRYARTTYAERFVVLYGVIALLGFLAALGLSGQDMLLPLVMAVPFGIIQLVYDARSDSRALLPELAGPTALGATASSIALAGGWTLTPALMLWVIIIARAIPSVLYVRARIRLEKKRPVTVWQAIVASLIAVVIVMGLASARLIPWLVVPMFVFLLGRAAKGLSNYRRPVQAKTIGYTELTYGLLTVVLTAIGYALGL
jgi:hypothetical protein